MQMPSHFGRSFFSEGFGCLQVVSGILRGGNLNPGERHSRDTRDDGLCTLRTATVLSRDCHADFGRPLTKKVMAHSRDGPGVTAPLLTNIVPLTRVWNPPLPLPPLKKSPMVSESERQNNDLTGVSVPEKLLSAPIFLPNKYRKLFRSCDPLHDKN